MSLSTSNIQQLLRPHLRNVTPYLSARRSMSGGNIWLNANESPYSNAYQVETSALNRYPNFQSQPLNQAYANYAGVLSSQLLSHRGSDESIELLIRSFCEPGQDRIMICPPTYGMYAISARLNNTPVVSVPLQQADWQLNLAAIKANSQGVKVVFLCNPSNPLGNRLNPADIHSVIQHFAGRALVVVDEAYIEYATDSTETPSFVQYLNQYDNLVVMRTLSKAFGLAAIRVGFTLTQEDVIQALVPVLAPYPLADLSIQVATQALRAENLLEMRQNVIQVVGERERLAQAMAEFPWVIKVEPSHTNFILVHVDNAQSLMLHCQQAGVLLRDQSAQAGLEHCIRITVGDPADNEQLIAVLNRYTA